jgi:hypothetical protein
MNEVFDCRRYRADVAERLRSALDACSRWRTATAQELWGAIQATGEKQRYGFGNEEIQLRQLWPRPALAEADRWLPEAVNEGAVRCKALRQLAQRVLGDEGVEAVLAKAGQSEVESLLAERSRLDAASEGVEQILERTAVEYRKAMSAGHVSKQGLSRIETAHRWYFESIETLNAVDELIEKRLDVASTATLGTALSETRSLIRKTASLPWWLDGTLELVAFAKTQSRAWEIVQPLLKEGVGEGFRELVFRNIERIGPQADQYESFPVQGEASKRVYEWALVGPADDRYRLQLLAPLPSRRARTLEMRVVDKRGGASRDWHSAKKQGTDPASPAWLPGRIMMLEGVAFRWIESRDGREVYAKVTATLDLVPGPLVLVDCGTNQVLKPFAS